MAAVVAGKGEDLGGPLDGVEEFDVRKLVARAGFGGVGEQVAAKLTDGFAIEYAVRGERTFAKAAVARDGGFGLGRQRGGE